VFQLPQGPDRRRSPDNSFASPQFRPANPAQVVRWSVDHPRSRPRPDADTLQQRGHTGGNWAAPGEVR